jgi:hypothetical protein
MVRPAAFAFNAETAASNAFQHAGAGLTEAGLAEAARAEFDALAAQLDRAGVEVTVVPDSPEPVKPDALFPNNWVSFHGDGSAVLYPMLAPNRRTERREEVLAAVGATFRIRRTIDLTAREQEGKFLEGTGSLVLDRMHRLAYACLSPRTHLDALADFAHELDYELVTFESKDALGRLVYHTNVMMAVGSRFAVLCAASIGDERHRQAVCGRLEATGHEIIDLSLEQMTAFAGNLLELTGGRGALIALSRTAWESLDRPQRRALERHGSPLIAAIPRIERHGGGGVRCMLAEIHLPRRLLR